MAQRLKAIAAKPDDSSLIPQSHRTKGELTPTSCPLTSPQGALWHTHSHRHLQNKKVNEELKIHAMKKMGGVAVQGDNY